MVAFSDVIAEAGGGELQYRGLYEEYEQRETLEARLVKAADVIDLLVQALALERAGARGLDEFWEVTESGDFQLEGTAREVVMEVLSLLLNARGKPAN